MNGIRKILVNLSVKTLYYLPKIVFLLLSPIWIYLLWNIIAIYVKNEFVASTKLVLFFILYCFIMSIIFCTHSLIRKVVTDILVNQIDMDKFLSYHQYAYQKNPRAYLSLLYAQSLVAFYRGDFEQYIRGYIDIQGLHGKKHVKEQLSWSYHAVLSYLHLDKTQEVQESIKQIEDTAVRTQEEKTLREEYIQSINWLIKIFQGQDSESPSITIPNRLSLLMSIYYHGFNEQTKGNLIEAGRLFSQLADEEVELYYVKEAQKYLKEKS